MHRFNLNAAARSDSAWPHAVRTRLPERVRPKALLCGTALASTLVLALPFAVAAVARTAVAVTAAAAQAGGPRRETLPRLDGGSSKPHAAGKL